MCLDQTPLPQRCYHHYRLAPQLAVLASLDVSLSVTCQAMQSVHPELVRQQSLNLELSFPHENQAIAAQIIILAERLRILLEHYQEGTLSGNALCLECALSNRDLEWLY